MKTFLEVIAFDILPALRALLTEELIKLGLNQVQISQKLFVTQPAISQYIRGLRGHKLKLLRSNENVMKEIRRLAREVAFGRLSSVELNKKILEICRVVKKEGIFRSMDESCTETIPEE